MYILIIPIIPWGGCPITPLESCVLTSWGLGAGALLSTKQSCIQVSASECVHKSASSDQGLGRRVHTQVFSRKDVTLFSRSRHHLQAQSAHVFFMGGEGFPERDSFLRVRTETSAPE